MRSDIIIRPETAKDFKTIIPLILRSFSEGTSYSDGTDVAALVEEIRMSPYYMPELSFVAEHEGTIVGHFMFSRFPLSPKRTGGYGGAADTPILMLAPVAVHADYLRQGVGTAMLTQGLALVKSLDWCKGITVEGDYHFYNRLGFRTSSEFGIYPTSGFPLQEPRCMMCQETREGSLLDISGYVVYDMYQNAS